MLDAGDHAPDFTLVDATGQSQRLADALARGPVVLAFMKADCATCTLAFPYLERLHHAYTPVGWTIWGISQNPARAAQWFAGRTGVTFPMLIDGEGFPVSHAYDPPATPTIFYIDRGGMVRSGHYGFSKSDLNALAEQVAAEIGEQPVIVAPLDDGNPEFKPG
ncbi:MAG: TlpA family protein disulfide reductase [Chloroflexi bacterium]|nr:TlpA family protein disulfide reductase [Chloroflexota bacterium]